MHGLEDLYGRNRCWIDGHWVPSRGSASIEVEDPSSEEAFGEVPLGTADDINMALEAANRALPMWREAGTDELAEIITKEVGAPVQTAGPMQVGIAIEVFKSFAAIASTYPLETRMGESLVLREAVGVVGCITPWNLPLILIAQKVAPALLAGAVHG